VKATFSDIALTVIRSQQPTGPLDIGAQT